MKKEKTVRTYQRRTKSGKVITVRQHKATYDAAEAAKEMTKKKGAGSELEERKKKGGPKQLEIPFDFDEKRVLAEVKEETGEKKAAKKDTTKKKTTRPVGSGVNGPAFTSAEFKEWYHGTGSAADKKVAKALRAQLGRSGYRKLEDEAIDNYSPRGHLKLFKQVSPEQHSKEKGAKKLVGTAKAQKAVADAMGAKEASKKFAKVIKDNSPKSKNTEKQESRADVDKYYGQAMDALSSGKPLQAVMRKYRHNYGYHVDHFGTDGMSKRHKALMKALSDKGYDESGAKKKNSSKSSKETTIVNAATLEKQKSLDSLKTKGYIKYGTFYFKPTKDGATTGSFKKIRRDGTVASLSPQEKILAKEEVSRKNPSIKSPTSRVPNVTKKPAPFEGDAQLKQEIANWKKSPISASGKASRNTITKLLRRKEQQGYSLTKREKALLGD